MYKEERTPEMIFIYLMDLEYIIILSALPYYGVPARQGLPLWYLSRAVVGIDKEAIRAHVRRLGAGFLPSLFALSPVRYILCSPLAMCSTSPWC
jgi:hypothetical protein